MVGLWGGMRRLFTNSEKLVRTMRRDYRCRAAIGVERLEIVLSVRWGHGWTGIRLLSEWYEGGRIDGPFETDGGPVVADGGLAGRGP